MITRRGILAGLLGAPLIKPALALASRIAPTVSTTVTLDAATVAAVANAVWDEGSTVLWPRTSIEVANNVWPYNPAYPPMHPLRYAV